MFESAQVEILSTHEDNPWVVRRRPTRGSDLVLDSAARSWLRRLPAGRRPLKLCETHPRVANRLAWCWADAGLTDRVLTDLLIDRRGGRQGFSAEVVRELRQLRAFNQPDRRA